MREIGDTDFSFISISSQGGPVFNYFSSHNKDVHRVNLALGWPIMKTRTERCRFSADPLLATCVVLTSLSSGGKRYEHERLFGLHTQQLSDIFREAPSSFMNSSGRLITADISKEFKQSQLHIYSKISYKKQRG